MLLKPAKKSIRLKNFLHKAAKLIDAEVSNKKGCQH